MDAASALAAAVDKARRAGRRLAVIGHGSKPWPRAAACAQPLSTLAHTGIVDYRPNELVLTARAGTPLAEVAAAVAAEGQLLPFDPPRFGPTALGDGTFGGAIASGLAGPARPWRGGARDAVLGVEVVNGLGERLRFGGTVMKNVAGYDVSRLLTGSAGALGVILSASVRLLPAPQEEATCRVACDAAEAAALCRKWARRPLPITATCWVAGALRVRLSGSAAAIAAARTEMALRCEDDPALWDAVRDHRHPFFEAAHLTRLSLPLGVRLTRQDALIEWGGCQAWLTAPPPETLPAGAFATPFRGAAPPPTPAGPVAQYAERLRRAFDPEGVFAAPSAAAAGPAVACSSDCAQA